MSGCWVCEECVKPIGYYSPVDDMYFYGRAALLATQRLVCLPCCAKVNAKFAKAIQRGRVMWEKWGLRPQLTVCDENKHNARKATKLAKREQWRAKQTEWVIQQGWDDGTRSEG